MRKNAIVLLLVCLTAVSFSQSKIQLTGSIQDTTTNLGVKNAVIMAVRVSDSIIVDFTKSGFNGDFQLNIPRDTFQILFTHPKFDDKEFYIMGNANTKDINFGKLVLPQIGIKLREVAIFSNNKPVFFRGDTLVMVADSFDVGQNANVEDLFKKLPGFDIGTDGSIVVQGKTVDKVLVDGDEFFGNDPTVATKNLPANAINEVEVFEETIETENGEEKKKVINLKLKEDSKQGSFGKLSGASDFTNFYEGEVLLNRFKGAQKISVYGLFSNTPRVSFDYRDANKYSLNNENSWDVDENGDWVSSPRQLSGDGLPSKIKTGMYYQDKFGKKNNLKFSSNVSYDRHTLERGTETNYEVLLEDSSYSSNEGLFENTVQNFYGFNVGVDWDIDTLTNLRVYPKVTKVDRELTSVDSNVFYTNEGTKSRSTINEFSEETSFTEVGIDAFLIRKFKKKGRILNLDYKFKTKGNELSELLQSEDKDEFSSLNLSSIDQLKNGTSSYILNGVKITYFEPLSKKLKLELRYKSSYSYSTSMKSTFNKVGADYSDFDSVYSNDFTSTVYYQNGGAKLKFTHKKLVLQPGLFWNQAILKSNDLLSGTVVNQNNSKWLPFMSVDLNISRSSRFSLSYSESVANPSAQQLQTIPDNRNLNNINIGNINLISEERKTFELNYHSWKATKGSHMYMGGTYTIKDNAFSSSLIYDAQGRAQIQTVNVDRADNLNAWMGGSLPILKQLIKVNPNVSLGRTDAINFVNGQENNTVNSYLNTSLTLKYFLMNDSLELLTKVNYNYSEAYNKVSNASQNFNTLTLTGGATLRLRSGIKFKTEVAYTEDRKRADGFNNTRIIWDGGIYKSFGEKQNFTLSVEAKDLLNQNISNSRLVYNNVIIDTRTNIIGRYVLLKAVYKFNVLKSDKDEGDLLND
ncbi:MAG: hypothetical protein ACI9N1_000665 [Flavobacteriales bacterium]|jgi:hypothetical protein